MASTKRLLVDNILEEIRRMTGESNVDGSITDEMLLDSINRAHEEAAILLARHYPAPLLTYTDFTTSNAEDEYSIPEDALEGRIQQVELRISGESPRVLEPREHYDAAQYEDPQGVAAQYPLIWTELGYERKIRLLPQPKAGLSIRIWYVKELPTLVKSQGKITAVDSSLIVSLDEIGDEISSSLDEDGSHLSVIDGQTGLTKGFVEVASINTSTSQITIRATPTVATIDNNTISGSFSTLSAAAGDFVCVAPHACISQIRQPFTNHMLAYAFAFLQYVNGGDIQVPQAYLARFEKYVESMKKGRAQSLQVSLKSHAYRRPIPFITPRTSS